MNLHVEVVNCLYCYSQSNESVSTLLDILEFIQDTDSMERIAVDTLEILMELKLNYQAEDIRLQIIKVKMICVAIKNGFFDILELDWEIVFTLLSVASESQVKLIYKEILDNNLIMANIETAVRTDDHVKLLDTIKLLNTLQISFLGTENMSILGNYLNSYRRTELGNMVPSFVFVGVYVLCLQFSCILDSEISKLFDSILVYQKSTDDTEIYHIKNDLRLYALNLIQYISNDDEKLINRAFIGFKQLIDSKYNPSDVWHALPSAHLNDNQFIGLIDCCQYHHILSINIEARKIKSERNMLNSVKFARYCFSKNTT